MESRRLTSREVLCREDGGQAARQNVLAHRPTQAGGTVFYRKNTTVKEHRDRTTARETSNLREPAAEENGGREKSTSLGGASKREIPADRAQKFSIHMHSLGVKNSW